ncbi:hypothetical protein LEP1GSC017_3254 [Leptospira meyeri serovar Hardjo str. Went 5]|uniref:hypothetical protein n=1 Tax=Leptospira meyeri TaxID=29508 RepID=UPI00028F1604|nr:hypothetical protein [Leptospira meyeri]EKJ85618.1 hypothetical protein LEP1GSC017_3254 [Leptospira meyeri serovar Hardjo str. Went 5]
MKPIFRLAVASRFEFRDQATLGSASLPSAKGRPSPTYPSRGGDIIFMIRLMKWKKIIRIISSFITTKNSH